MSITKEEYLKSHPSTYEWKNGTLDVTLPLNDARPFSQIINSISCPLCGNNKFNIPQIANDVYGIQVTCNECKQKWFIHKYLQNGGTFKEST